MTTDPRIFSSMASRALLISADVLVHSVLSQVLAEMAVEVDTCSDAAAAFAKISGQHYAVIVVDIPDVGAADRVLREIRLSRMNQDSLAIGVVDAQASVRNTFSMGANLVLYRPLSEGRVRASLRAASHLIKREKRRHQRLAVHAPADISYPAVESAPATLLDLSEAGLAFQSQQRLPSKGKVYLRFTLPGQARCIQLSGDIMWQDSTGRAGIQFVDVPQTARRSLKEWLESKMSQQEESIRMDLGKVVGPKTVGSAADRRIESRHACNLGTDVYHAGSDVPYRSSLTDISVGGCYLELTSPFPTGSSVELTIRTRDFKFRSRGVVTAVHPGFGMGVAFEAHTAEQSAQVQHLIMLVHRNKSADAPVRF
jgi:DNA-binding response OmpR family regulator